MLRRRCVEHCDGVYHRPWQECCAGQDKRRRIGEGWMGGQLSVVRGLGVSGQLSVGGGCGCGCGCGFEGGLPPHPRPLSPCGGEGGICVVSCQCGVFFLRVFAASRELNVIDLRSAQRGSEHECERGHGRGRWCDQGLLSTASCRSFRLSWARFRHQTPVPVTAM